MTTPLEAAHRYATQGWRVIPIPPGYKHPRRDNWQNLATTNTDTINQWWTNRPGIGVGIATGQASGIFVLDVDIADNKPGAETLAALEHAHATLPATIEAVTGTGGRHLYFTAPAGTAIHNEQAGRLGPGLDIRGEGGQVLAPPTVHPNGTPYQWRQNHAPGDLPVAPAPAWLIELLTSQPPRQHEARRTDSVRLGSDTRPGDRFNAATTWPQLLEADGWRLHSVRGSGDRYHELWTRPGKELRDGASASLYYGGTDLLKLFTSSAPPLEQERTYDRFGYYTVTVHNGDYEAAARALGAEERLAGNGPVNMRRLVDPTLLDNPSDGTPADNESQKRPRPFIVTNARHHDEIVAEAWGAILEHNQPARLFQRAGQPTRIRNDEHGQPYLDPMGIDHIRLELAAAARWTKQHKDGAVPVDPPPTVCASVRITPHHLPGLIGLTELPIIHNDATITTDGYDPATRLYHIGDTTPLEPLSPAEAAAILNDVLADFPFDTDADKANAWALLLTPFIRPLIDGPTPLALIDAPEPGTGKGLLAEIVAIVATGRPANLTTLPNHDDEIEKRITSMLLTGQPLIVFDNLEHSVKSAILAAALTAETWQGRILGSSTTINLPARVTWMATGNNVTVGGDLARRCYRIRLDARRPKPWERTGFRHADLRHHVRTNRHRIVSALATLTTAWLTAGRPPADITPLGGFTPWATTSGGILAHAGIQQFLNNIGTFHADADAESGEWEAFLSAIGDITGGRKYTAAELTSAMDTIDSPIRANLPTELADSWGTGGFTRRLGRQLARRAGRHYGHEAWSIRLGGQGRANVQTFIVAATPPCSTGPEETSQTSQTSQEGPEARGLRGLRGSFSPYAHAPAHTRAYAPAHAGTRTEPETSQNLANLAAQPHTAANPATLI